MASIVICRAAKRFLFRKKLALFDAYIMYWRAIEKCRAVRVIAKSNMMFRKKLALFSAYRASILYWRGKEREAAAAAQREVAAQKQRQAEVQAQQRKATEFKFNAPSNVKENISPHTADTQRKRSATVDGDLACMASLMYGLPLAEMQKRSDWSDCWRKIQSELNCVVTGRYSKYASAYIDAQPKQKRRRH